ncbi:uncharacterized protein LOC143545760 [Bidens hawaiensis]|uniref:uncharacterized protein LOC143545760 n=1 Tax=Bidens hawaiensis TaxID=980011 RepID=UPI0040494856
MRIVGPIGVFARYRTDYFTQGPATETYMLENGRRARICDLHDPPALFLVRQGPHALPPPRSDVVITLQMGVPTHRQHVLAPRMMRPRNRQGQDYGQHSKSNPNRGSEKYLNKIEELLTRQLEKDAQYQQKLAEHHAMLRNQLSVFAGLQDAVKEISGVLTKVEEGSKQISQCVYESDSELIREIEEESVQLEEQLTPGYKYDSEGNYLGYMNRLVELFPMFPEEGKEPIMEYIDDSEENILDTETRVDDKVPPQATQRSLVKKEEIEDVMDLVDSLELMFGVEKKVVNELSEEDEFLDLELDGLSEYDEGDTLDINGDVAFFEALFVENVGSPSYFYNEPDQGYQYKQGQDYGQHSKSNPNRGSEKYLNKIEELLTRLLEKDAQYQQKLAEHHAMLRNQLSVFAGLQDAVKEISGVLTKVEEGSKQISQCVYESDSELIRETEEESVQLEEQPTPGYKYDLEGNYLGYMNRLGELFSMFPEEGKEPIMEYIDDSEENIPDTETRVADKVPPQATQRLLVKKEEREDVVDLVDSLELMFGVEKKVVNELSEEDEFLDLELDGLSEYDEGDTLDVNGDVAFFEALIVEDVV